MGGKSYCKFIVNGVRCIRQVQYGRNGYCQRHWSQVQAAQGANDNNDDDGNIDNGAENDGGNNNNNNNDNNNNNNDNNNNDNDNNNDDNDIEFDNNNFGGIDNNDNGDNNSNNDDGGIDNDNNNDNPPQYDLPTTTTNKRWKKSAGLVLVLVCLVIFGHIFWEMPSLYTRQSTPQPPPVISTSSTTEQNFFHIPIREPDEMIVTANTALARTIRIDQSLVIYIITITTIVVLYFIQKANQETLLKKIDAIDARIDAINARIDAKIDAILASIQHHTTVAAANAGPTTTITAAAELQHPTTHPATPHNNSNANNISPTNTATSINGIIIMNENNEEDDTASKSFHNNHHNDDETAEGEIVRMEKTHLHQRIIDAAIETANTSAAPTFQWEEKHNLFALCTALPKSFTTNTNKTNDSSNNEPKMSKNVKKLHKFLTTSPHLLHSRSANMVTLGIPDGYTILHAACHVGNVEVVTYLLDNFVDVAPMQDVDGIEGGVGGIGGDGDPSSRGVGGESDGEVGPAVGLGGGGMSSTTRAKLDLNEVDVQGKTALHIAAERGHIEVIKLLIVAYDKSIEKKQHDEKKEEGDECEITASSATTPLTMRTPKTPFASFRLQQPPPTFAGPRAPVDLSGRTPLGSLLTSPVPKARQNRAVMEKLLYMPGDRSIFGHGGRAERTTPRARCGSSFRFSPSSSLSPMTTVAAGGGASARRLGRTLPPPNSSYLSPTPNSRSVFWNDAPRSSRRRTPSNYTTPTIFEEDGLNYDNMDYLVAKVEGISITEKKNCLQWGASEMNGFRVVMEDKILVKYEVYGEESPPPPLPPSLNSTDINAVAGDPISMGLFGVFDGHGDVGYASNYIATNLCDKLQSHPEWALAYYGCNSDSSLLSSIFTQSCHDLDKDLRNAVKTSMNSGNGGSTAIMALICNRFLFVANIGDSRCILVKKKTATKVKVEKEVATSSGRDEPCWDPSEIDIIPMSEDHKPNLPKERARIESAGLTVQTDHVPADDADGQPTVVHRVRKSDTELIGVARAFGDHDFKSNTELSAFQQALVCTPDIVVRERMDDEDMYLILACDGIWDVMSNEEVGEFVARRVAERENWVRSSNPDEDSSNNKVEGEVLARVGDDLLQLCVDKNSRDNMSALIVAFPASGLTSSGSLLPNKSNATMPAVADVAVRTLAYE